MAARLSTEMLKDILLSANEEAREPFVERFGAQVAEFAERACAAYEGFVQLDNEVLESERSAWARAFLYSGFNSLVTSFHLLASGLMLPAGNLMRSFSESMAMGLLCSCREINLPRLRADRVPGAERKPQGQVATGP